MALRPKPRTSLRCAGALALAMLAACQGGDPKEAVVARVGEQNITVEQVADYMARSSYGVNRDDVARAVDELIDLSLVKLRARERYTPTRRDSLQIKEWNEMLTINQFREDVIWKSVQIDEAKLRAWYDENVGEEVRARHILVSVSPTASEAERKAARAEADSLFEALQGGADFAALARAHSDDSGSAQNGGLLQWFRKGEMVEPFEKAAFEGTPGKLYPQIVETQFGFHILKVEEKRRPRFEDLRDSIEEQLASPQRSEAEQAYVTRSMENSGVEFYETNIDTLIALLDADPEPPLSAAQRSQELATFRAGRITLGEIWDLYETLPPANQRAIAALDQTEMVRALAALVQQRLLLADAQTQHTKLDTTRQRQLDERVDQLFMEQYLREVGRSQLEVPDSLARRYYDEHREFYRDQPFDEVREQIRTVLVNQRIAALQAADAERKLVAAVADSHASRVKIERHENRYDDVLARLREKYEEQGREPEAVTPAAPAPPGGAQPSPGGGTPGGAAEAGGAQGR